MRLEEATSMPEGGHVIARVIASTCRLRAHAPRIWETFVNEVLELKIDDGSDEGSRGMRRDTVIRECRADSTADNASDRTRTGARVGSVRSPGLPRHKKGA